MATINSFEELDIWQLGREICKDVWDKFEKTSLGKDFEILKISIAKENAFL